MRKADTLPPRVQFSSLSSLIKLLEARHPTSYVQQSTSTRQKLNSTRLHQQLEFDSEVCGSYVGRFPLINSMRAVLPGLPRAKLQAVCTGYWDDRRLIVSSQSKIFAGKNTTNQTYIKAYITGNALVILTAPNSILQTIYDENEEFLDAIAIDEVSGKIATCTGSTVRIYKPYGQGEDALKVCGLNTRINRNLLMGSVVPTT